MNRHTRFWVAAAIIAAVVLGSFLLSVPRVRDGESGEVKVSGFRIPETVALQDSFRRGTHTIRGVIEAPNACSTAEAAATLQGDAAAPTGIQLAITLTVPDDVCLQLPTQIEFSTTIEALEGLSLSATINGTAVATTTL